MKGDAMLKAVAYTTAIVAVVMTLISTAMVGLAEMLPAIVFVLLSVIMLVYEAKKYAQLCVPAMINCVGTIIVVLAVLI